MGGTNKGQGWGATSNSSQTPNGPINENEPARVRHELTTHVPGATLLLMSHRSSLCGLVVAYLGAALFPVAGCGGDDGGGSSVNPTPTDGGLDSSEMGDAPNGDTSLFDVTQPDSTIEDGFSPCGDGGCPEGTICKYGVCVPDLGTCATSDDCRGDTYCDTDGVCVPYGVPPSKVNDPNCSRSIPPNGVKPVQQCEWSGTDPGDPTAEYINSYSAPMVADLNLDLDANKLQPSVVLTTFASVGGERIGMLRVFDGRTCVEQMRIGGPDDPEVEQNRPGYGSQWAIGDLDGDVGQPHGHPEIVGLHRTAGPFGTYPPLTLIAFGIDSSVHPPVLVRRWIGRICSSTGGTDTPVSFASGHYNYGPGIWDLDDDGRPEVVIDKMVFDADGCLLNPPTENTNYLSLGVMSTIADVDLDGRPDLVRYDGIYGWDTTTKQWVIKPWATTSISHFPGHVAVADLGAYSTIPGKSATDPLPEIIVVSAETTTFNPSSSGTIRVQTLTGEIVFGPMPLYHLTSPYGGHGGPPTASDFDGDGQVEFAVAANEFYTVYDPDCVDGGSGGTAARPGGTCIRADPSLPDGVLWAQPSQDFSSSSTGSSIFDFDGDGAAEAVYADECYLRVYDGSTGDVIFSVPRSSGTGYELPVICDVDGDFATEIVVARATNNPACPSPDPLFAASGDFERRGGFSIFRDPEDLWAASRPIWNQHAYSITNVNDDATIPRASQMLRNWEQPDLNNFRQNTQGDLDKLALADLTVKLDDIAGLCAGQSGQLDVHARVCNRGTNPVQDGVSVAFYSIPKSDSGSFEAGAATLICQTVTDTLLTPGTCTLVMCSGVLEADHDVYVVVDPDRTIADCHPENNHGATATALCPGVK